MAYGSSFGVAPGERFFRERGYYRSGSFYQNTKLSSGQSLNKRAVRNLNAQLTSVGTTVFNVTSGYSEQKSIFAAQQLQQRVSEQASNIKTRLNLLV